MTEEQFMEKLYEKAYKDGYDAGYRTGYDKGFQNGNINQLKLQDVKKWFWREEIQCE